MESGISKQSIVTRKIIHLPLAKAFEATLKHKPELFNNEYLPTKGKPTIYSATHVFYDDIASILCLLKENAYLLSDNDTKEQLHNSIDGLALFLNGVLFFDKYDSEDRKRITAVIEILLNNGGNLLAFPESTWNFSPNLLVQNINWGLIEIAKKTGADLVPVAVDLVKGRYLVNVGKKINLTNNKKNDIINLRDKMATLAYELIEQKGTISRYEITDQYWQDYIKEKCGGSEFDLAKEESCIYRPKDEISLDEIIADMFGLEHSSMASNYDNYQSVKKLSMNFSYHPYSR